MMMNGNDDAQIIAASNFFEQNHAQVETPTLVISGLPIQSAFHFSVINNDEKKEGRKNPLIIPLVHTMISSGGGEGKLQHPQLCECHITKIHVSGKSNEKCSIWFVNTCFNDVFHVLTTPITMFSHPTKRVCEKTIISRFIVPEENTFFDEIKTGNWNIGGDENDIFLIIGFAPNILNETVVIDLQVSIEWKEHAVRKTTTLTKTSTNCTTNKKKINVNKTSCKKKKESITIKKQQRKQPVLTSSAKKKKDNRTTRSKGVNLLMRRK